MLNSIQKFTNLFPSGTKTFMCISLNIPPRSSSGRQGRVSWSNNLKYDDVAWRTWFWFCCHRRQLFSSLFISQIICINLFFFGVFVGVCVAGYSRSKNEILELRLPLKLLADENKVKIRTLVQTLSLFFSRRRFRCYSELFLFAVVFRVSAQNGILKFPMVVSQTVRFAASHTSLEQGEFRPVLDKLPL